ncbi:hypothetical protein AMECASPLE_025786 [Ameca splendens]|uniref:Uncharacterized protein n=1 Tax=Ameca splendens TaxID=208324 RepID=A0ABV1ADN8_9TELE
MSNSESLGASLNGISIHTTYGIPVPLAASRWRGSFGPVSSPTLFSGTSGKLVSFHDSSIAQTCEPESQSASTLLFPKKHLMRHFFPTNCITEGILSFSHIFLLTGFSENFLPL